LYKGTPFEVTGKLVDFSLYEAPFKLKILNKDRFRWEVKTETYSKSGEAKFGDPVVTSKFSFLVTPDSNVINKNAKISEINYQFRFHDHKELIDKYAKVLKAEPVQESSVITVSIEDEVLERGIDFLNTLVALYIENSVSLNKQSMTIHCNSSTDSCRR